MKKKSLLIFFIYLIFQTSTILFAQKKNYTITPKIAERIGQMCIASSYSSNRSLYMFCLNSIRHTTGNPSVKEADIIIESFYKHLDCAENFIIDVHNNYSEEMSYHVFKEWWFSIEEIKIFDLVWEKELKRREIANEKEETEREKDEKKRQQQEEIRQKQEQDALGKFKIKRADTVYSMGIEENVYDENKQIIIKTVREIIPKFYPNENISFSIQDKCTIDYSGNSKHEILVNGIGYENTEMGRKLKEVLSNKKFNPLYKAVPNTSESLPVTSQGIFKIDYRLQRSTYQFVLIKKQKDIFLKEGDVDIFSKNQRYLNDGLKRQGRYIITLKITDSCNIIERILLIENFRKPIDNVSIGYNYSRTAPLGIMLGFNKISYSKCCGIYGGFKTSIGIGYDDENFEYTTTKPNKDGYARLGITAGGTFAIMKNFYFYAGLGYGYCSVRYNNKGIAYDNTYGETSTYQASCISGLELEGGFMWRFVKHLGVSAGYSCIVPFGQSKFFGDINLGISLIF